MSHSFFSYFSFFKREVGSKLYLLLFLSVGASFLDGLGITALLPLISLDFSGEPANDIFSQFFFEFFHFFNVSPTVTWVLLLILGIFFLRLLFNFTQMGVSSYISTWLSEHLKRKYAKAYNRMDYEYYISTNIGYFNNIITTECGSVVVCFKRISDVVVSSSNMMAYLFFSFFINWRLTVVVIISGLFLHVSYKSIRNTVAKVSYAKTKVNAQSQNILIQYVSNYKYLKATANGTSYLQHLFPILYKGRMLDLKNQLLNNFTLTTFDFFRVVLLVVAIFYMVEIRGEKVAEVFVPMALIARSFGMALKVQTNWQAFMGMSGSIVALREAWAMLTENSEPVRTLQSDGFRQGIYIKNVGFSYGDKKVLKNISVDIKKGQCIGVAGASGSGKTTLIDIITGLLDPNDGEVEIDGKNYDLFQKESLRSIFGYVTQEPIVFNDTIENNITFWDSSPDSKKKLHDVMDLAGCAQFVSQFAEKENTVVGDRGIKLSGGQRQRLSIARELYQDSDVMIMDEATASLDSESEKYIQDSIDKLVGLKTIIIIAHRLSTLKMCDEILVLKDGSIAERGNWDDLLSRRSIFAEMCSRQGITS